MPDKTNQVKQTSPIKRHTANLGYSVALRGPVEFTAMYTSANKTTVQFNIDKDLTGVFTGVMTKKELELVRDMLSHTIKDMN